jgi:hypothetical protein
MLRTLIKKLFSKIRGVGIVFTVIAAKVRAVVNAAQIPMDKCFKLWGETAKTVTALDNSMPVTWNGETKA